MTRSLQRSRLARAALAILLTATLASSVSTQPEVDAAALHEQLEAEALPSAEQAALREARAVARLARRESRLAARDLAARDKKRATATATPKPAVTSTPSPIATTTSAPAATATTAPSTSGYLFGTLLTDHTRAAQEQRAGVKVVHLEIGWDNYEPREGAFNETYIAQTKERLRAMQAAGMHVVLGVGLQYPPSWVYTYPNSRYVNQYGVAAGPVNLTFSQALRERADRFIARVHQDLGLQNFWAVRIGSGGLIESLYPGMNDGTHANSYWGFDGAAQGGAGRPPSVPASPFPGWKPGDRSYNGQPFSTAQVQQWYDWYLGAMVDGINWQIATYKRLGYTGNLHVLMPGLGSRPSEYAAAIGGYLDGTGDGNRTMGRAAVWHKVVDGLADRSGVVIYVSSLADGSGNNNVCQPGDASVSLSDPVVSSWSAARWLAYNANRYGLAKNGENPGKVDTRTYGTAMMDAAANQMRACGFQGMMWAHDFNLYDGASGVSLADYSALIAKY